MNYVVRVADTVVLCKENLNKVYGETLDFVIAVSDSADAIKIANYIRGNKVLQVQEDLIKNILGDNTQVIPKPLSSLDLNKLSQKIPLTRVKEGLDAYLEAQEFPDELVTMIYEVTRGNNHKRKAIKRGEHIPYIVNAVEASNLPVTILDYLGTDEVVDLLDKRIAMGEVNSPLNITRFFARKTDTTEGENVVYVDGSVSTIGKITEIGIGVTLTTKEGKSKSYSFEITHMPKALVNANNLELLALMLGTRVGESYFKEEGFTLYSDSLYTLLSLYTYYYKRGFGKLSDNVYNFIQHYKGVANLEFRKVKSHVGVLGNEKADFCAKEKGKALDMNIISNFDIDVDFDKYERSTYLLEQYYVGRA